MLTFQEIFLKLFKLRQNSSNCANLTEKKQENIHIFCLSAKRINAPLLIFRWFFCLKFLKWMLFTFQWLKWDKMFSPQITRIIFAVVSLFDRLAFNLLLRKQVSFKRELVFFRKKLVFQIFNLPYFWILTTSRFLCSWIKDIAVAFLPNFWASNLR